MILTAAALLGCSETPTEQLPAISLADVLTPDLASDLTSDGLFRLKRQVSGSTPSISPERAGEQALAFIKTFGPIFQSSWEEDAARAIEIGTLEVGPRIYLVESPYGPLPSTTHAGIRKAAGSYYVVTLLQADDAILSVAVSTQNTDVTIEDGRLRLPPERGNDFIVQVLPEGIPDLPMPPEQAARAAAATGANISGTPTMLGPELHHKPQQARWKIELDRPVSLHRAVEAPGQDPQLLTTRVVYIDHDGKIQVPRGIQPEAASTWQRRRGQGPGVVERIDIPRRNPTSFIAATPSGR